ncbi:MAG: hypothetical protein GY732_00360 [Gammaproteobacteria bacterium]|nr:hypothetical protein [Gammaproteobacteria bacterium]
MKLRSTLLAVITLLVSAPSWAVEVDGKDWLQPVDFLPNLSWNDVAVVCPPPTGACNGTLGTTDVTGYTWASVDDINSLFNVYGVAPPLSGPDYRETIDSAWAPAILGDFDATYADVRIEQVWGWSRTVSSQSEAYAPAVEFYPDPLTHDPREDEANTEATYQPATQYPDLGAWLYLDLTAPDPTPVPTPVPTSGIYGLILTILGLAFVAMRRLSRRKAI